MPQFGNVAAAKDGVLEHEVEEWHGKLRMREFENLVFEAFVKILDGAGLVGVGLRPSVAIARFALPTKGISDSKSSYCGGNCSGSNGFIVDCLC